MKIKRIDKSLEKQFCTNLITSDEFCKAVIPSFDSSLLEVQYSRFIADWCIEYYEQYKEAPKKNIQAIFKAKKSSIPNSDDIELIAALLEKLSNDWKVFEPINTQFSIDESLKYLKTRSEDKLAEDIKAAHEVGEDATKILADFKPLATVPLPPIQNANDLMKMKLTKSKYVVEGLIAWGAVLLVGKPKTGKSYFVLQLAASIATGREFLGAKLKTRGVLLVGLEDGQGRIQSRLTQLGFGDCDLSKLNIMYQCHKGTEGLADISARLDSLPNTRIVIIDPLIAFRALQTSRSIYQSDYYAIHEILQWAQERNICVIIVHHEKKFHKGEEGDLVESVSGTYGLAGACDQVIGMRRTPNTEKGTLESTGREIREYKLALSFNPDAGGWEMLGNEEEYAESEERRKILKLLEENGEMKLGNIAAEFGKSLSATTQIMTRMLNRDLVRKIRHGIYGHGL
jgi:hypothetical protein